MKNPDSQGSQSQIKDLKEYKVIASFYFPSWQNEEEVKKFIEFNYKCKVLQINLVGE